MVSSGGIFYINLSPSVVVMRMRRYYALQLILGWVRWFSSRPATILTASVHTEVDKQNARPSKVLTTERLVFFSEDYKIESGQGNERYCFCSKR